MAKFVQSKLNQINQIYSLQVPMTAKFIFGTSEIIRLYLPLKDTKELSKLSAGVLGNRTL